MSLQQLLLAISAGGAPPASLVESIQYGTISFAATSATTTISAVDTTRSSIFLLGMTTNGTGLTPSQFMARVSLTNGTTVTANKQVATNTVVIGFCVVQWAVGVTTSCQHGTITTTSSAAATLSSVITTNSAVIYTGHQDATGADSFVSPGPQTGRVALTSATAATFTGGPGAISRTCSFNVVEFAPGVLNSSTQQVTSTHTATSNAVTITSVDATKTLLTWGGYTNSSTANDTDSMKGHARAELTNGTTVTTTKPATVGTSNAIVTVIEFKSADIASKNSGSISGAAVTSATATVSAVNTAKSILCGLGFAPGGATSSANFSKLNTNLTLTNSTTVTANTIATGFTGQNSNWELIEFN